jgi:DNA-binding transcriptional LysR family regulator
VAAGNGIGIVNPYVASAYAEHLLIRPLAPEIEVAVRMAMPAHTAPSLLARHFVDALNAHLRTLSPFASE